MVIVDRLVVITIDFHHFLDILSRVAAGLSVAVVGLRLLRVVVLVAVVLVLVREVGIKEEVINDFQACLSCHLDALVGCSAHVFVDH